MEGQHGAGKGDRYRSVNYENWSKNWDSIFKKKTDATDRTSNNRKNAKSVSRRAPRPKG